MIAIIVPIVEIQVFIYIILVNDDLHYEGHIIRYLKNQCDIDNLEMGTVLLGGLEKFGWVVLKCVYEIINGSDTQRHFYNLNNDKFQKKTNYWNKTVVLTEKCCMICDFTHMNKDYANHVI